SGILQLDDAQHFGGTVAGFGTPDAIDLIDIGFGASTSLTFAPAGAGSGTLTVTNGAETARIGLLGQFIAGQVRIPNDGHGGTLVTERPAGGAAAIVDLALPLPHPAAG